MNNLTLPEKKHTHSRLRYTEDDMIVMMDFIVDNKNDNNIDMHYFIFFALFKANFLLFIEILN